jgi:hypothetical protein
LLYRWSFQGLDVHIALLVSVYCAWCSPYCCACVVGHRRLSVVVSSVVAVVAPLLVPPVVVYVCGRVIYSLLYPAIAIHLCFCSFFDAACRCLSLFAWFKKSNYAYSMILHYILLDLLIKVM